MSTQRCGTVKWFDAARHYGFVTLKDPDEDALLHLSVVQQFGVSELHKGAGIVVELEHAQNKGLAVKKIISLTPAPDQVTGVFEKGTVKWFNTNRGYGWVARKGLPDVFVHATVLKMSSLTEIHPNQEVVVLIEPGPKGPKAVAIKAA